MYRENLYHTHELQKQAYNEAIKPKGYVSDNKVWLNSKYIKTKHNYKLIIRFFGFFPILHLVENQIYKLDLPKKMEDP